VDFGVVLQTTPPAARVVEYARQAELNGFGYAWTFDSHLLWQEPYVIYSQILAQTRKMMVGPMVTNPATRDWSGRLRGAHRVGQAVVARHAARVHPRHQGTGQRARGRLR
jgi:hypothetical protein